MRQLLFAFFFLTSCNTPPQNREHSTLIENTPPRTYKVIGIKDGDSIVIWVDSMARDVRLLHIDCPERGQPFGDKARKFVAEACFGQQVSLLIDPANKYDRNGRLLAEVFLANGRNLNKELVKNGMAWHYKSYSDSEEYARLEIKARGLKTGLWNEPNPIAPWLWRHPKK